MADVISSKIIKFSQKIGWITLRPILKFFIRYRLEIKASPGKFYRPLIVVSNHTSYLDPSIIGTILPFNSQVYPIYFITKDTVATVSLLGGFLKLLGAFRAWKGEGLQKALEEPKKILQNGYSVVFFPQGHRSPEFHADQGRPGAAALALETNKPILPIGISGLTNFSWKNFFLRKYHVKVKVGQPFSLKEKLGSQTPPDLHQPTEIIMREIERLLE